MIKLIQLKFHVVEKNPMKSFKLFLRIIFHENNLCNRITIKPFLSFFDNLQIIHSNLLKKISKFYWIVSTNCATFESKGHVILIGDADYM